MLEREASPRARFHHFFVLATFSLRFLMCFFTFSFLLADFSSRNAFFLSFLLLGDSSRGLLPSAMLLFPSSSSSTSTPDSAREIPFKPWTSCRFERKTGIPPELSSVPSLSLPSSLATSSSAADSPSPSSPCLMILVMPATAWYGCDSSLALALEVSISGLET